MTRWVSGRLPAHARHLADTQDLVQETVLHTLKHVDTFKPGREGALAAYLRRALLNRIRDELARFEHRSEAVEAEGLLADEADSPLEEAIGRQASERYERALARLSEEERYLIIARVELGYTYEELAEATAKTSADAARKAARRAVLRLADEMRRDEKP